MPAKRPALPWLLFACCALTAGASDLPVALPASRYAALAGKSMFAPAAPVATMQAKPSFAADLFVVGLAQFENKDFVMIINRKTREKFSLITGGEKGPDDVELASVRWANDPTQSAVTVKRGADSSVLEFDQAAFQKPDIPAAAAAPNMPPMPFQVPRPPSMPQIPNNIPPAIRAQMMRRLRVPGGQ